MQTLDNIIKFHTNVKDRKAKETEYDSVEVGPVSEVIYPTKEEVAVMNALVKQITDRDPDAMVPVNMWNGSCYQALFNEMEAHAKKVGTDPWDMFALMLNKMNGWRMEKTKDGSYVVKYGKN